jgi:methylenetetrahydrofolate dehydrogenase (NADP+)/methenyltetrahydrofolate cyclohydrolase
MAMLDARARDRDTVCHSRTADLAATSRRADIVVAAVGRPGIVTHRRW